MEGHFVVNEYGTMPPEQLQLCTFQWHLFEFSKQCHTHFMVATTETKGCGTTPATTFHASTNE